MSVRANRTAAEPRVVIYVIGDQTGSSSPRRITPRRSQTDLVLFSGGDGRPYLNVEFANKWPAPRPVPYFQSPNM